MTEDLRSQLHRHLDNCEAASKELRDEQKVIHGRVTNIERGVVKLFTILGTIKWILGLVGGGLLIQLLVYITEKLS